MLMLTGESVENVNLRSNIGQLIDANMAYLIASHLSQQATLMKGIMLRYTRRCLRADLIITWDLQLLNHHNLFCN